MSFDTQHLYDLLPAVYRLRDLELATDKDAGGPLKQLLDVIAGQVAVLEEDLDQLYDDQFIETCADWVVPYIGQLIGYRTLHGEVPLISSPRAEVAHTIAFRRRKGTAAMLEQLAHDVTGWNSNVVEYFLRLGTTQFMNHVRLDNLASPDLRQWEPLERIGTPFDSVAHTVDVRRIATGRGLYNIPNVGLFLWRLEANPLTASPAFKLDDRRWLFSPLGNNTPLFTNPQTEKEISHLATPLNVPAPISRRDLDQYLASYYGHGDELSLSVTKDGVLVPVTEVVAADLSDFGAGWAHKPKDKVAIDPVLGRIAFPEDVAAPAEVSVRFHYGFAGDMGGGEYDRRKTFDDLLRPVLPVAALIQTELDAAAANGGAVVIADNRVASENLSINLTAGHLELRASNSHRPTIVLTAPLDITGGDATEVTLNGLVIAGAGIRVLAANNKLSKLHLVHCTFVPGLALDIDGNPTSAGAPSLEVRLKDVEVTIDHCIMGGLRITDQATVSINDSIIDAQSQTAVAYAAVNGTDPGGTLLIEDSTVIGRVHTELLDYASNCIFLAEAATTGVFQAPIRSERRQAGCVRFSYLPLSARTPRRYRCEPEQEIAAEIDERERHGPKLTAAQKAAIEADVVSWLVPRLTSTKYGDPGYGQLHFACPRPIYQGAEDEAEMGAFHKLYEPQRETNLRVRLDEYLRFGLEAGIFYAT